MNKIFVANKPLFLSSNHFLSCLKRKDNVKKAGFSGTLDPFACGALLVAYGQYTKLFCHLNKNPKIYEATLWLGVKSESFDTENIISIQNTKPFSKNQILNSLMKFQGEIPYIPPKYCAKKIDGKKAYELARSGAEVKLKEQTMEVYKIEFLNYCHPFVSFRASVSEGSYIRSLGQLIAQDLGVDGTLSYLCRISEGGLFFENYKTLNPLEILPYEKINRQKDTILKAKMQDGKKITKADLKIEDFGDFIVYFEDFFSIISHKNNEIKYLLNRIPLC